MENAVFGLRCNHVETPLGLDTPPAFSWCNTAAHGPQTAWRIGVSSSRALLDEDHFDCWDSGTLESGRSQFIDYAGTPLTPRTRYAWKVFVTHSTGSTSAATSWFETAKLDEPWQGQWIAAAHHQRPDDTLDAPLLRRAFDVRPGLASARLYICSPGYFEAHLNGRAVSTDMLSTPFTKFDRRLLYCTYDVADCLAEGANALGVTIGNGWYNCFTADVWNSRQATWRHIPKLIAELHLLYEDGSAEVISSDASWKSSRGPITFNGIRNGEYCDARLEIPDWHTAALDDSGWEPASVTRPPGGLLSAMEMEPIRVTATMPPLAQWQTPDGGFVFDAGQNLAGIAEITVEGAAGDEIVVRYAEQLHEDGVQINPATVSGFVKSGDFQTDRYIKGTDEPETWRPRFVYHGFQYIEVTGCTVAPTVKALVVHTDVADRGAFSCDDDVINRLQHATRWATLTNLHGLPTDDPHREKNAWTGDVALSAEQMLTNFHTVSLLRKWLADIRDSQRPDGALPCVVPSTGWGYNWGNGPDWSSALTLIPWNIYVYTGDRRILQENYDAIRRHFAFMESMAQDLIVNYGIGDWCPPFDGPARAVVMSSFKSPTELTDTACFYNAAVTIAKMAAVLNRSGDADDYAQRAAQIKTAFRERFYDAASHAVAGDCQTSTACMMYQGLIEESEHEDFLQLLLQQIQATDHHQDTGILGNKYLHNTLGEAGRMDVSLRMILNDTYPSFRHWIERGATTLWECWNGEGSQNHHMFSDISAVFHKYVGGIRPDEADPGFRHILMEPAVDCGLSRVACSHTSPYGVISTQWEIEEDTVRLRLAIPAGSRASFALPSQYADQDFARVLGPGQHEIALPCLPRARD